MFPHIEYAWMHATPPGMLAIMEYHRGKAFMDLNCRVQNTLYALKNPRNTVIKVGYMDMPDGTVAKHLWVIENGTTVVDKVAPSSFPRREAIATCTLDPVVCMPAVGMNNNEFRDFEWINIYLLAFVKAYKSEV
jgi:hypothetical protein